MKTAKHTPGPWVWVRCDDDDFVADNDGPEWQLLSLSDIYIPPGCQGPNDLDLWPQCVLVTPIDPHVCEITEADRLLIAALPDLAEALRLNWEHTDGNGRLFYCNCPRFDRLSDDSRKDRDERHATGCQVGRAALRKAGLMN